MPGSRDVGGRFRSVRRAAKFALAEVAEVVGCSSVHYAKIESGNNGWSEDLLQAFAAAFGEDPEAMQRYIETGGEMPPIKRPAAGAIATTTKRRNGDAIAEVSPVSLEQMVHVPLLGIAQAAGYEPVLEPLVEFLEGATDDTHAWPEAKSGYFALRIEGESMCPEYPPGTILLVAGGEFPERGDIVVARLSSGQVVAKEYSRRANVVTLASLNASGQSYEWNVKDEPGYVVWMFPVIRADINLRRRRWERHHH